jgi:uncharacterized membrane protein (Fun14 family)
MQTNSTVSAGVGFLFGAVAGYAVKKVMKIAAVIIGLFVVGISYKGWIDVKMDGNRECNKGYFNKCGR